MAQPLATDNTFLFLFSALVFTAAAVGAKPGFVQSIGRAPITPPGKLTHLRFYWQDVASGRDPTAVTILKPLNSSSTFFGAMTVTDDLLTEGPKKSSRPVGRAQGFYSAVDKEEVAALMVMNFVFTAGEYNGSTLAVLGRNQVMLAVREMPVVGGSGVFKLARGYVQARTYWADLKTGDGTVEYNVYAIHY